MTVAQEPKDWALVSPATRAAAGATETTADRPIGTTVSTHHDEIVGATPDLAEEFGVEPGTELQRRSYEMTDQHTGLRLACTTSYLPQALIDANPGPQDEHQPPRAGGHQPHTAGIEIQKMTWSVTALMPSPGDRQRWGLDAGVPLLAVRTRSMDASNRVVEVSDAVYPADRTELVFPSS